MISREKTLFHGYLYFSLTFDGNGNVDERVVHNIMVNLVTRDMPLRLAMLFFLICFSCSLPVASARSGNKELDRITNERREVERNLQSLKKQLGQYRARLAGASRQETQSLRVVRNINNQILIHKRMIAKNQDYLTQLDQEIDYLEMELQGNRQHYDRLSGDFARTAVSVYKYGGNRDMEHLFGATSLNNAIVRARYMGFFTAAVTGQVDTLQKVAGELEHNRSALQESYSRKAETLKEQEQELQNWAQSKTKKEKVLKQLQANKQRYASQLAEVQQKRRALQAKIEALILAEQREIEAERKRAEAARRAARLREEKRREEERKRRAAASRSSEKRASESVAEPGRAVPEEDPAEIRAVSVDFEKAYGSLPWPVQNGVVVQKFGTVEDRELRIVTTNNGIDISVPTGSEVKAVSGGKVVQIAFLPTFGNIVIIRHSGSYLTVYANLGQLRVTKDEVVRSRQLIGVSGSEMEGGSVVHFEIWKGRSKMNPEKWLR